MRNENFKNFLKNEKDEKEKNILSTKLKYQESEKDGIKGGF